jgi:ubiquinone/menaquinone biosynthesis C-methylase UbiE
MHKDLRIDTDIPPLKETVGDQLALGANARLFFHRVYAEGLGKYTRRLEALGLSGGHRALDAGCGLGQWSLALAGLCGEVNGVDISHERIDACRKISRNLEFKNVEFAISELEHLPFRDDCFDRVVCYSVLNLTHYEKSIEELARVTLPGGLVYISTNDVGRYVYDIVNCPNPAADFNPRTFGAMTFWNTFVRKRSGLSPATGGVIMNKSRTIRLLRNVGFEIVDSGPEGRILQNTENFMSGDYCGLTSTFDVLARKR